MHAREVLDRIQALGDLPVLPQVLLQIQKVAADESASADDLAKVIQDDQALTAKILKIVNSAFYTRGGSGAVKTVPRAVIVLGFEVVRKLTLGLSVFDMMSRLSRSPHLIQISEHSLVVAAIARRLAEASGRVAPEEAFVAALVHDIGKLVLIECSPGLYDQVMSRVDRGAPVIEAERDLFGIAHDRAGRKLAASWGLPRDLQEAIGEHHAWDVAAPPRDPDPLTATLAYADAMSRFRLDLAHRDRERTVMQAAATALGIPGPRLKDVAAGITAQIDELAGDIEVPLQEIRDYAALLSADAPAPESRDEEDLTWRTAEQLELYRRLGQGMARGEPMQLLLELILRGAQNILGLQRVILFRVDRDQRCLHRWMTAGTGADELARKLELPLEKETGALALSALSRRSYYIPAAQSVGDYQLAGARLVELSQTTSFATAPVVGPHGVMAVLWGDLGPGGPQLPAELARELSGLAVQAGLVVSTTPREPVVS